MKFAICFATAVLAGEFKNQTMGDYNWQGQTVKDPDSGVVMGNWTTTNTETGDSTNT